MGNDHTINGSKNITMIGYQIMIKVVKVYIFKTII